MKNITFKIDNRDVSVPEGSTILDAAEKLNISIPTLCYSKSYEPHTSCMVCVVQDLSSGKLIPSCTMPAQEGMRIGTANEKVIEARKDALDFLLSEHVGDCEAPCRIACPANMNIPLMNRQIKEKKFTDALGTVKKDIALPAVLGRICPAPCEKACNRKPYDQPVAICHLKRFAADTDLALQSPYRPPVKEPSGKKVAIIGAGPTGLSAAYYLVQAGHECFIYDKNPQPGGMLRYGVPKGKLPPSVLDTDIQQVLLPGVHLHLNRTLGKDISLNELTDEYDALVLALGAVEPALFEGSQIRLAARGIEIDKKTFETSVPGIFAGGNAVGQSKMAIRALAHGKDIHHSVNQFLNNKPITGPPRRFNSRIGKLQNNEILHYLPPVARGAPFEKAPGGSGRRPPPLDSPRKLFINEFSGEEAINQSTLCLDCDCRKPDSCKLRQYAETYNADQRRFKLTERNKFERIIQHDMVVYEPGKCIKCGLCVQITKKEGEPFGLTFIGRGFDVRVAPPFSEPMHQALQKTAAQCIQSCPTGALSFLPQPSSIAG